MSKLVNVKINGRDCQVPDGMNLIDAAKTVGVHIPNFCYMKGMKGIGACRMCLVEINGRQQVACIMKTKEGMDVVTENEKIAELRKFVVDLILSMHPLDCMTCTKAGVCKLQKYAYEFEIKESSFTRKKFGFAIDGGNPFIKRDPDYCILCARCVRVCKEQGTAVLDFEGRGVGSKVSTAGDKPLEDSGCTFCGSCVDACPVNALLEADRWRKGREWEYERTNSVCLSCGSACAITASTHDGDVAKVTAGSPKGHAARYMCAIGRFGFDSLNSDTRVLSPMTRQGGALKETSWADALAAAAGRIKGGSAGIITNASITNETALAVKNLAAKAGIDNIDSTASLYGDEASLTGDSADIEEADLIVLAGLAPTQWERTLAAIDAIIRKKVDRKSAKLIVINSKSIKSSEAAEVTLTGDEAALLKALAKAVADKGVAAPAGVDLAGASVDEAAAKAGELYAAAEKPLILTAPSLFEAAANVAAMKGVAVAVPFEANAKGVVAMSVRGKGKSYAEITTGGVKVLYVIGETTLRKRPAGVDFLVVQTSHMDSLAAEADVVLPSAMALETDGTIVDYLGRLREVKKAAEPVGEIKAHEEIIGELGKAMGLKLDAIKKSEVEKAAKGKYKFSAKPFKKRSELDAEPAGIIAAVNRSIMGASRLLWLTERKTAAAAV
jgi:NADH dehydrogenase/NADH:ubiquinone oxidoreductase subunit G